MITQPLPRHAAPTVPFRVQVPWALTGWGVALLGVGFGLGVLLLAAVLAPVAVVVM